MVIRARALSGGRLGARPSIVCFALTAVFAVGGCDADEPEPCASGTYDHDADSTTACMTWTTCAAGQYVLSRGSAVSDRQCEPCASESYTASANLDSCLPFLPCAPGTVYEAPGSATHPPVCTSCSVGTYCAGGLDASIACNVGEDTWDHDADPATYCEAHSPCSAGTYITGEGSATTDTSCTPCALGTFSVSMNAATCVAWTTCEAGQYVSTAGSMLLNQVCSGCGSGSYSGLPNQPSCTPWSVCESGFVEDVPGSETEDRACVEAPWVRQFGSTESDRTHGVRADSAGNVVLVGYSDQPLPAGTRELFVRKYGFDGNVVWTRTFSADPRAVSVDASDDVLVAGYTSDPLGGEVSAGLDDAFVRKYSSSGALLWTRQFGSTARDQAEALAVDGSRNVLVAGYTAGALPGQSSAGLYDAFVRKYSPDGTLLWTRQFGTSAQDYVQSVTVDAADNVLVAGVTSGTLPSQSAAGLFDAFVRKYSSDGTLLWTRQFGSSSGESVAIVVRDGSSNVFAVGQTYGDLAGATGTGPVFVRKYLSDGTLAWTRQFGSAEAAYPVSAAVDGFDNVLVLGNALAAFPGEVVAGGIDAFVVAYDNDGTSLWAHQFGSSAADYPSSMCVLESGSFVVSGFTLGTLPGQTSGGGEDAFLVKITDP